MDYFRFQKGWPSCTECIGADVIAFNKKTSMVYEVEVKISKSDLYTGEAKKDKHIYFKDIKATKNYVPNYYSICLPYEMEQIGLDWIEETNLNYGLMIWRGGVVVEYKKNPKRLHSKADSKWPEVILARSSSEVTNYMKKEVYRHDLGDSYR